jgi:hypothetical protein
LVLQPSDQAALKALTARGNVKETPNGEPSESRSAKVMKDSLGSALAVPVSEGTSQVISLFPFPGCSTRSKASLQSVA